MVLMCICHHHADAEPPSEPEYNDFVHIVSKKPFGPLEKKQVNVDVKEEVPKPKNDWVLQGVTEFADGWLVVIANKKTPKEQLLIREGVENEHNIDIEEVIQNDDEMLETEVKLQIEGENFTVRYNPVALQRVAKSTEPQVPQPAEVLSKDTEKRNIPLPKSEITRPRIRRIKVSE